MLLSHSELAFESPTVLVRADHQHAEVWFGSALELTLATKVARPELPHHDHPSATGETHHDEAGREYVALLAKTLSEAFVEMEGVHVWLVMEPALMHELTEKLSPALRKDTTRCLDRDLMKEELSEVVARARAEGTKLA